jgi:hypothetical protein
LGEERKRRERQIEDLEDTLDGIWPSEEYSEHLLPLAARGLHKRHPADEEHCISCRQLCCIEDSDDDVGSANIEIC